MKDKIEELKAKYAAGIPESDVEGAADNWIKSNEKTMTVKEIAQFTGKTERAVRKWIVKAAEKSSAVAEKSSAAGHGKIVNYTIDEVEAILSASSLSKDAVSILMQNARSNSNNVYPAKETSFSEKDIKLIATVVSMAVRETIQTMDGRITAIENKIHDRAALLPPPELKPRDHINMLIRKYAQDNSIDYKDAYKELYRQYSYRTHSNPSKCASERGMTTMDYIDSEGQIQILESIAIEMCTKREIA